MTQVADSIGKFFGFFFVLVVTITVLIAAYAAVAGQPIDKTWSAVEALIITAAVLLVLALLAAFIPEEIEARRHGGVRSVESADTTTAP